MPVHRGRPSDIPPAVRRLRLFLAAGAALVAVACATPPVGTPLQSNAAAPAPAVSVGDSWAWQVRDGYTGLERGTRTETVTAADGNRVTLAVSSAAGHNEEVHVYDRQLNWLRRPATNLPLFTYEPAYRAFDFPLTPGKQWRQRLTASDPRDGRKFPIDMEATVVGWERIRVPAGEFDAIKVRRVVYIGYWEYAVRGESDLIETDWYVPAVKRSVRRETFGHYVDYNAGRGGFIFASDDSRDGGGPKRVPDDWLILELTRYSVR